MTHVPVLLLAVALLGPSTPDPGDLRGHGHWPLDPVPAVVNGFDAPESPWGSGHRGADLAGAPGQVVRAALPGKVVYAGPLAGRGVVVVNHGETRTTYEPVAAAVAVGELVRAGAPIGRLMLSGSHCPPRACLHWGWLEGASYLDPRELVGAGHVRLLPLSGLDPVPTAPPVPGLLPRGSAAHPAANPLPWLLAVTRVGALVGRPSGVARS